MSLQPGSLLNQRYRIEDVIAKGGMGAIYRAVDETLNIPVAVKENFFFTDEYVRQFRREATLLAGLNQPNLPRVTDHFSIEGQGQYLVMDYIEGEDLREIMQRQGVLSEGDVVSIGAAVCQALAYLHTRQPAIVHRDIKPGNIKVTPGGGIFLVDFGLAKVAQAGQSTTTGAQALTPGYAPPEQYGQGTEPRSDIYSLGATLYAALTGKIPEDGLARAMGSADLTPVRKLAPAVSSRVAAVLEKAMDVQPARRYQNADEFRAALLDLQPDVSPAAPRRTSAPPPEAAANQPTRARTTPPPTSATPEMPPARSGTETAQRGLPILPILGGTAVVALLVFALLALPRLTPTPSAAAPTLPVLTARAAQPDPSATAPAAHTDTSPTDLPAASTQQSAPTIAPTAAPTETATPSGGAAGGIAFASNRSGVVQIWQVNSDGSQLSQLTNLPDGACQPDWSPDGQQMVFISPCGGKKDTYPGSSLFLIQRDGTHLVPLASLPGGDYDPAWSPDGIQIAFTSLREGISHIFLYKLADANITRLSRSVNYERRPAWSPDGKLLAYESNRAEGNQVWVMNSDGSDPRMFSDPNNSRHFMPGWAPDQSFLIYSQGDAYKLTSRQIGPAQTVEFLITDRIAPLENARISPDGWWVTFNSRQDGNEDVFVMTKNGANLKNLSSSPTLDWDPTWSPR